MPREYIVKPTFDLIISDEVQERNAKIKSIADKTFNKLVELGLNFDEITEVLNTCKSLSKSKLPEILEERIEKLQREGEEEIWESHPDDERYKVSSFGRFRLPNKRYTFGSMSTVYGYMIPPATWLEIGCMVHIVVAKMFPELVENSGDIERKFVGHRDDIRYHNNASNLICLTPKENSNWSNNSERHAAKTGISIRCIETGDEFPTITHAAEVIQQDPRYKTLNKRTINTLISQISGNVKKRKNYGHVGGFHFEKIEY